MCIELITLNTRLHNSNRLVLFSFLKLIIKLKTYIFLSLQLEEVPDSHVDGAAIGEQFLNGLNH